jgi:hypothetical protein
MSRISKDLFHHRKDYSEMMGCVSQKGGSPDIESTFILKMNFQPPESKKLLLNYLTSS